MKTMMRIRFGCLAVAVTGTFLIAGKGLGAPHEAPRNSTPTISQASRLISGPRESINNAIAAGPTTVITLQPVPPQTLPATSYPAGSSIVDQTLTLGSVPARIWLQVLISGWAPEILGTAQVTISATDSDLDGGGYSAPDCAGNPVVGAGSLAPAMEPCPSSSCAGDPTILCATSNDCTIAGTTGPCDINGMCRAAFIGNLCGPITNSRCETWTGVSPGTYFPAGKFCAPGFQALCDPRFVGSNSANLAVVDISTYDFRYGFAADPTEIPSDFNPSYLGTLVLDVPANAKGTYTIDANEPDSYFEDPGFAPGNNIPVAIFRPAFISIPCSPLAEPVAVSKTRFISILMPSDVSTVAALRVTLVSLHHVDPPYTAGPTVAFTSFEGEVRWVGPPAQYLESTSTTESFYSSMLQCIPHYQDWSTVGLLHVTGSAIVPSSVYKVQSLNQSCMGNEESCTAVSPAITVATTRWGDVELPYNPPETTTQPDLGDVSALVNKFKNQPAAPIKARAFLVGDDNFGNITSLDLNLNFNHISACIDAFKGRPYPFAIQSCP